VFHCRIVGEGPERESLERAIAAASLADVVELVGALPHDAVLDEIRQGQVFALPCVVADDGNRDTLPTVIIEAMALGRPVVSTDLEGVTEMVRHNETGLLVSQRDSDAPAAALDRVLFDHDLAVRLGCAGRQRAEALFDLRTNITSLRQLFAWSGTQPQRRPMGDALEPEAP
jgi:colanic acid/amylovoran biosynthesis glycosyltransferase